MGEPEHYLHRGGNGKASINITSGFLSSFISSLNVKTGLPMKSWNAASLLPAMQHYLTRHVQETDDNRTTRHPP